MKNEFARKVETKDLKTFKLLSLEDIKNNFNSELNFIKNDLKLSDERMLRAQVVFLISALDFFLHKLIVFGMDKMFHNEIDRSELFNDFKIELKCLLNYIDNNHSYHDEWFPSYINEFYSTKTLFSFDSIKLIIKTIGLELDLSGYKNDLSNLVSRRNEIAHQTDRNMVNSEVQSITLEFVNHSIKIVEKLVEKIYQEIKSKLH